MSTEKQSDIAVAEKINMEEIPKYNVVVHNNDITSYDEVIFIVARVFDKSDEEAFAIARNVDTQGRGICGTYDHEIAEAKLLTAKLAKEWLIEQFPHRREAVSALLFTKEEIK